MIKICKKRALLVALISSALSACGGGSSSSPAGPTSTFALSGTVVDGPVVSGTLRARDATGREVASTTIDGEATYSVDVPADAQLPISLEVSDGTNLVTGEQITFRLLARTDTAQDQTVNVSTLSTIESLAVSCSTSDASSVRENVLETLSMGLNLETMADPVATPVTPENAATFVVANEALAETVRRTEIALRQSSSATDGNGILRSIACDVADGQLDANDEDVRLTSTFRAAQLAVLVEAIAGELKVNGENANALIDNAIQTVMEEAPEESASETGDRDSLSKQATEAVSALYGTTSHDDALLEIGSALVENDVTSSVSQLLANSVDTDITALVDDVALADSTKLEALSDRMKRRESVAPPRISLSAERLGDDVRLSWSADRADECNARGNWKGPRPTEGTTRLRNVTKAARYTLACVGPGGIARSTANVSAIEAPQPSEEEEPPAATTMESPDNNDNSEGSEESSTPTEQDTTPTDTPAATPTPSVPGPAPEPEPAENDAPSALPPLVTITADRRAIIAQESVTLRWSSQNSEACRAEGAWSGGLARTGSRTTAPLSRNSTFRVVCTGPGGSAQAQIFIAVTAIEELELVWTAPSKNRDGTQLEDLSGYRFYFGTEPGFFSHVEEINDPAKTSHTFSLPEGRYHIVMTAMNEAGRESHHSNELIKETR